jgi:hypothetical protein
VAVVVSVASAGTLASNRAAAKRDAPALAAATPVSPGATKVTSEPAGDNGYLKSSEGLVATTAGVVASDWWTLPPTTTPAQAIAYVQSHLPAGGKVYSTGSGGNFKTGTSSVGLTYSMPTVPGVLDLRLVAVTATTVAGGGTGLLAEAESVWLVPRPASAVVPASARVITVTRTTTNADGQAHTTLSRTIDARGRVRQTVAFINNLETVQPFTTSCPAMTAGPAGHTVTLRFSAKRGGPALASVSYDTELGGDSYQCNPVALTVHGHQTDLLGGAYVKTLSRLLGVKLN